MCAKVLKELSVFGSKVLSGKNKFGDLETTLRVLCALCLFLTLCVHSLALVVGSPASSLPG